MDKTFIIAELSANHNQNIDLAVKTIKAAKKAGADALKIQTYTADTMTIDCKSECFKVTGGTLWDEMYLYDLYKKAYTPWEWHAELQKVANELGLIFFSSPFDKSSVDFLETLNVPLYKIASFEITDLPLIKYTAAKGKPIIISTGIATLEEIEMAISTCKSVGNDMITLLKCTSAYPTSISDMNLSMIADMELRFKLPIGLSDHSLGDIAAITAVSLGATVIEKHFILDRTMGGPDSAFSMEPTEFRQMVDKIREVESVLGEVNYELNESIKKNRKFARSLFVVNDIKEGELFTYDNIKSIRPNNGCSPALIEDFIDKVSNQNIVKGTPLFPNMINNK